jgi:mannose-1-phosphate guanylyltransferase
MLFFCGACSNFDLGTWGSLYANSEKDDKKNAMVGKNVMLYDTKNCIINMPKDKLVVIQGLDDFIVVESDDILLICKKKDEQNIRTIVNDVKINKGDKFV